MSRLAPSLFFVVAAAVAAALSLSSRSAAAKSKAPKGWQAVYAPMSTAPDAGIPLPPKTRLHGLEAFSAGGQIVLWGPRGREGDVWGRRSVVAVFDPEKQAWRAVEKLGGVDDKVCAQPMAVAVGDRVLITYGEIAARVCRRVAVWFDPSTDSVKRIGGTTLTSAAEEASFPEGGFAAAGAAGAVFYRPNREGRIQDESRDHGEELWVFDLAAEDWRQAPPNKDLTGVVDAWWRGDELVLLSNFGEYSDDDHIAPVVHRWRLGDTAWQEVVSPTDRVVESPKVWGDSTRIVQCCGKGRHKTWNLYRWISPHESKFDFIAGARGASLDLASKKWVAWSAKDVHKAGLDVLKSVHFLVAASRDDGTVRVLKALSKSTDEDDVWRLVDVKVPTVDSDDFDPTDGHLLLMVKDELWKVEVPSGKVDRALLVD